MNCIYKMGYYLAIKRKEELINVKSSLNLENIMLNESGQSKNTMNYMIPFLSNIYNRQIYKDKKSISGCQGLGLRRNEE